MQLSELLNEDAVVLDLAARTKPDAIVELVERLERAHGIDSRGEILREVRAREEMMSTGIGLGVAIPHGKTRSLDRMAAVCGVSAEGIDFDADDGEPVHLIVLFVSSAQRSGEHVRVLASISRLLKDESVRLRLREAASPGAFIAVIRAAEVAATS